MRHQDVESEGFVRDILSDDHGVSVHRFQTVVFNLIFGVYFVTAFLRSGATTFPVFSEIEWSLLGISSSAYLYLKSTENRAATPAPATTAASDELPDAEADRSTVAG